MGSAGCPPSGLAPLLRLLAWCEPRRRPPGGPAAPEADKEHREDRASVPETEAAEASSGKTGTEAGPRAEAPDNTEAKADDPGGHENASGGDADIRGGAEWRGSRRRDTVESAAKTPREGAPGEDEDADKAFADAPAAAPPDVGHAGPHPTSSNVVRSFVILKEAPAPRRLGGGALERAASATEPGRSSALWKRRASAPIAVLSVGPQRQGNGELDTGARHAPDHLRSEDVVQSFADFEKVGMGSTSVAYRARRLADDRTVVLKAMRRRNTEKRFLAKREFSLLEGMKHPNIISALDFLESPSCVALVLEDFAGRRLRSAVRSAPGGRLAEPEAMGFFVQVVSGLDYLHERSLVHRDLKPDNVLVSAEGLLKIIDFNVACCTRDGEPLTPTGTRELLAPEVLRGDHPYTEAADIWSAGLCLHFMLRGQMPARCTGDALTDSERTHRGKALQVVQALGQKQASKPRAHGDDDGSDDSGIEATRASTEQPIGAWGSSMWALRRCLHEDWWARASASELLAGVSRGLAG